MSRDAAPAAGYFFAFGAYIIWGLYPFYWSQLNHVEPLEILAHRILWCLPCALPILLSRQNREQLRSLKHAKQWLFVTLSALCITNNWFLYIWMVSNERVQDASLGYFLTPLMGAVLGVVIYRERLNITKLVALAIAAAGVLYLVISNGSLPLAALALAFTFAIYGPLRRSSGLGAVTGLLMESILLSLPAVLLLAYLAQHNYQLAFANAGFSTSALLIVGGVMTFTPLAMYAAGARRLELSNLSVYFYTVPSLIFVSALALGEQISSNKLLCFACIWLSLAIYSYDLLKARTRKPKPT